MQNHSPRGIVNLVSLVARYLHLRVIQTYAMCLLANHEGIAVLLPGCVTSRMLGSDWLATSPFHCFPATLGMQQAHVHDLTSAKE